MATKIQLRRDTSDNWAGTNPILAQGEPGVELDTKKMKVGDGIQSWNDLDYVASGTSENSTTNMFVKLDGIDGDIGPDWSGVVSVSTDGLNWTPSTFNQEYTSFEGWDIYHLAVGNGRIVYHTYDFQSDRDEMRWAYNPFDKPNLPMGAGSDASRRGPNGEEITWNNIRYVGEKFIAVGYYEDSVRNDYYYPIAAHSTDGDNWTRINIDLGYCHTLIVDERSVTSFGVNGLMMEDVAYGDNGWLFVTHWGPSDTTGGGGLYAKAFYVTDLSTQLGSANAVSGIPGAYTVKYDGKGWVTWSNYDTPTGNGSILYINSSSDPRTGTWTQIDMDTVATTLTGYNVGNITDIVAGTVDGVHWMMVGTETQGSFASNDGGATWRFIQTGAKVAKLGHVSNTNPAYITSYWGDISENNHEKVTIVGSRISQLNGTFYIRYYNGPSGLNSYLYSDTAFTQPLNASSWGNVNTYVTVHLDVKYGDHTAIVDNATNLRVGMHAEGIVAGFSTYENDWQMANPNVITAIDGNKITMKYPWRYSNDTNVQYEFRPVLYNTYGDGITSMAYGDGAFVGFSYNDGVRAYRTTDLTTWEKTTLGNNAAGQTGPWSSNYLNSVAYGAVTTPASTLINNSETLPGYASYLTVGDSFKVNVTGGDPEWTSSNLTEGYSSGGIEIDPDLSHWYIGVTQDVEGFYSGPDPLGIATYRTNSQFYDNDRHDSINVMTPNYTWSFDDEIGQFLTDNLHVGNGHSNLYINTDSHSSSGGSIHINSPYNGYINDNSVYGYNSSNVDGEGYAALSYDDDVNFVKVDYYGVDIFSGSDENSYNDSRWYFRNDCNGDNWGVLYQPDSAGIQTAGYWWIGDYQNDWQNTYIRATNWLDPNPVDILFSAEGSYGNAMYVMGRDGVLSVPYGDGVFQSEGYWAIGDYTYYDDSYAHIGDKSHTYIAAADNIANTPIPATALVSGLTYVITTVGDTVWTNANTRNDVSSQVNTVFVYDGTALTGTGYAKLAGHDIEIAANDTYFYFNRTGTIELPAGGDIVDSSGHSVLSRDMPQTLLDSATDYTITLNDRGRHLYVVSAGDIYIPTHAAVAFPRGTCITVVTDGTHSTHIKAVDSETTTLVLSKTGPANTVTGIAVSADTYVTMLKVENNRWMIQVA
jgi:Major tropism determinant N-terminal domain